MEVTYRIIKLPESDDEEYGLFEVLKKTDGSLACPGDADLYGDDITTIRLELELMMQALTLPILDENFKELNPQPIVI